jgi:hypothetical protein
MDFAWEHSVESSVPEAEKVRDKLLLREKEYLTIRMFPGKARSSFW